MPRRTFLAGLAASCAALLLPAHAQTEFPRQIIKIVVPYGAGSGPDVVARVVGEKIGAAYKQPVVVENKVGASGMIGSEAVARSPADGHTLLLAAPSNTIAAVSGRKFSFDPVRDFAPVGMVVTLSPILVTAADSPWKNLKELIAAAKAQPGKLTIASGGVGNSQHLAAEMLNAAAGMDLLHVPFKSTSEIVTALVNKSVDVSFVDPSAIPMVKSGRIRALAVGPGIRSKALPDVPTVAEAGVPGFNYVSWYGFMVPARTPHAVIASLNRELQKALADPDVQAKLVGAAMEPRAGSPEVFGEFIEQDMARWKKVIATGRIRFE
ncbi:MAG: tripartite tricarboxylate transporter substrate binding protein [Burkholderiales bacterium]|nr:tripartite tricarboxylate transporter substrate binding protein [Burkholderiales bacterium]